MHWILLIVLPVHGHLGGFYLLAILCKAVMNTGIQVSVEAPIFIWDSTQKQNCQIMTPGLKFSFLSFGVPDQFAIPVLGIYESLTLFISFIVQPILLLHVFKAGRQSPLSHSVNPESSFEVDLAGVQGSSGTIYLSEEYPFCQAS